MLLTRPGNKSKLAPEVYKYFPQHKMRITLFFGAGGLFFNTPKAKYNIANDLDNDVFNLFQVVLNQKEDLKKMVKILPVSESLFDHWLKNKETDPVKKALRFLFLSNFSYMGKADKLKLGLDNSKRLLIDNIEPTFCALDGVKFTNRDFREVIPSISFSERLITKEQSFVYLDPVYLDREHTYKVPNRTKDDTFDCFEVMSNEGILITLLC